MVAPEGEFGGDSRQGLEQGLRTVSVNGQPHALAAATLAEALVELGFGPGPVATALNGDFVPVGKRGDATLAAGDRLEVLTARQGG